MPSAENPKTPIERLADRDLIDTVIKLREIPVSANSLEELQAIFLRHRVLEALIMLALSAQSDETPDDRFAGPSVFIGGSRFFREYDKELAQPVPEGEYRGSMLALGGLHKVTADGERIFTPTSIRAHSNDGVRINLHYSLDPDDVFARAEYDDTEEPPEDEFPMFRPIDQVSVGYSYNSLGITLRRMSERHIMYNAVRYRANQEHPGIIHFRKPKKEKPEIINDPSTILLCIRGIANKLYEAHQNVELEKALQLGRNRQDAVA